MCGICGYISRKKISIKKLKEMNDTMYHRGPNDSGEEIFDLADGYQLGMAQRRLSILDLSELGHQPMHSCNDRVVITYNGEIYNFLELREQLKDYPFKSQCDTEVILAAYLKWGIDCINKFQGMFAIALYDRETDILYLVRDRIGKKPLYYWAEEGNLVFASELKPIMSYPGFSREIRKDVMKRYLFQQYICEPDSIFKNVYKVEPGQIVSFKAGKIKFSKYWDIAQVYNEKKNEKTGTYEEAKDELKKILIDSVKQRMIADVPLGTFLSGGYDSSLVTAIAQSISDKPVKTYSIGFSEKRYNEAGYAKEVAQYLGTEHTELYIKEQDMFAMLDELAKYYDEPFADSSQIPTMLVSQLAARDVTVALSGDGGDEFFCGYNMYDRIAKAQRLDALGGMIYGATQIPGIRKLGILDKLPLQVQAVARNRDPLTKTQVGSNAYPELINQMTTISGLPLQYPIEGKIKENNWQERRMLVDEMTYLPGDILCKVDRASMRYSLEARCPILDVKVMEYAFRLPHEYKYSNGIKKRILKDIVYDYIPRDLLDRPKVGFSVPLDKWLRGPLKEQLIDVSNMNFLKKQDIFEAEFMNQFINKYLQTGDEGPSSGKNYSRIVWAYYVFQSWYLRYMSAD